MDAVRWVLGECKASELRGESMQDVIFNGSGSRKPAGRASVELVFDNASDARAGRRPVEPVRRDRRQARADARRHVELLINNQPVRRRDVQDVFLGTGLGPRAYAIIGQGTISRIIESRPEELRLFLEEAAGVSKYKERRRETENRLKDTRENLLRVEDILRELNANLEKLEQQAVVAQRYRDLERELDGKQKLLWLLRANEAATQADASPRRVCRAGRARRAPRRPAPRRGRSRTGAQRAPGRERRRPRGAGRALRGRARGQPRSSPRSASSSSRATACRRSSRSSPRRRDTGMPRSRGCRRPRATRSAARRRPSRCASSLRRRARRRGRRAAGRRGGGARLRRRRRPAARRDDRRAEGPRAREHAPAQRRPPPRVDRAASRATRRRAAPARRARRRRGSRRSQREVRGRAARRSPNARPRSTTPSARCPACRRRARRRTRRSIATAATARSIEARLAALKELQERVQTDGKPAAVARPSRARHACRACGSGCTSRPAGRRRSRPRCASASARSRSAGSTARRRSSATRRRPSSRSTRSRSTRRRARHRRDPSLAPLLDRVELRDPALRAVLGEWLRDVYVADDEADALARREQLPPARRS